jgi:hypothetical protein
MIEYNNDTLNNVVATHLPQKMQQFEILDSNTNADDFTGME